MKPLCLTPFHLLPCGGSRIAQPIHVMNGQAQPVPKALLPQSKLFAWLLYNDKLVAQNGRHIDCSKRNQLEPLGADGFTRHGAFFSISSYLVIITPKGRRSICISMCISSPPLETMLALVGPQIIIRHSFANTPPSHKSSKSCGATFSRSST